MTIGEFTKVLLAALYNETAITGYGRFKIGDIVDRYSLDWKVHWADNILDELGTENFAKIYWMQGDPREYFFSIAAGGVNWVEQNLGENLARFLESYGAVYAGTITNPAENSIDSSLWTGRPSKRVIDASQKVQLIKLLEKAERDLEFAGATNSEKAMARAYIIAAKTLAEAPEPPEDMIWELIARANSLAGVASLFVSIVALFVSVGR